MRLFAVVLLALAFGATAAAAAPNPGGLILTPTQVGAGYLKLAATNGVGLKNRTLDLCGVDYPSEKLRTGRLQVNYLRNGGMLGLSNEVVVYKAGGTAQAMREVIAHATHCPSTPIAPGVQGLPKLSFKITRLTDSHLLKGYLAVRVRLTGIVNGKYYDQISYAVYQRLGNVFSGVYSWGPGDAAQMTFCLHAAEQSAKNLRKGGGSTAGGVSA
jgi:hypothetical protein